MKIVLAVKFKYPGFDVAFCTGIWIIFGIMAICIAPTMGRIPWYFIAVIVTAIPALGMWFQLRFAGYVFGSINGFLALIGILAILLGGFSTYTCLRVAAVAATAWISFRWALGLED